MSNSSVHRPQQAAEAQGAAPGIKLYKYLTAGSSGRYEPLSADATYSFYDASEGSRQRSDWFLEIGDVDVRVDEHIDYIRATEQNRITFSAGGTIYALKFPSPEAFNIFCEELHDKFIANTFRAEEDHGFPGFFDAHANFADEEAGEAGPAPPPEDWQALETGQDTIHGIVMGALENDFVIRGTHFDVLRNLQNGGLEDKGITFAITPPRGGAAFTPTRVLLAQQESKINLLSPDNPHLLHHADIETEKIVQTFVFKKDQVDIPIIDIANMNKASQLTDEKVFLGLDKNRLAKWDLRDPHGVVQQSPAVDYLGGHEFSRGHNFTCMATSGAGYVAVGSQDGTIRLYSDTTLSRAATNIPKFGVPITSIDVTYDGKWVLATTANFLLVLKTTVTDSNGRTEIGFKQRLAKKMAPPRLLRLLPEDQVRVEHKPFTKGKFQWVTESGKLESWIVANVGKFSVIWNFADVKSAVSENVCLTTGLPVIVTDYHLRAKDEVVVESAFMHHNYAQNTPSGETQTPLVVATRHGLFASGP